ncbi:MAG: asparagine synthase (glutamine-hydrolyzing) [Bacteroidales bacterium]|nr:asparagine synthase (glutamine-hydrolyzing) [Bacteroidales bacterium]
MCGIAGYYSVDNSFIFSELDTVGKSITSRGPEYQGTYSDDRVGLVHRRLKIIDLSDESNQPMFSDDRRYVIAYNGEVYNYDEIRRCLRGQMHTKSDTEVVLKSLIEYGLEAIADFNGMFAIALYDSIEKKLLLIRDRMGVKPLYYYWDGKNFAFASEIKALLQFNTISKNKTINYSALNQFLHLGYSGVDETIYNGIFKLPAGSYMEVTETGIHIEKYWSPQDCITKDTVDELYSAKEILRDLVEQSVRYRLRSDVPYGTFLSGGIDSSLVTAVAQRNLSTRLKTFTIGFAESKFDERTHAKEIAEYLGTDHTELVVTEKDALALVPRILDIYDEPFADSSAIPTLMVSQLAKTQTTMVLSGDGGDELFMGYGAYTWAERLQKPLVQAFHKPISLVLGCGNSWSKRASKVVNYPDKERLQSHIFSQEQYLFSQKEIASLVSKEFVHDFVVPQESELARELSAKEKQALFDMNYYLREDLLTKVDRASMHHSLEVRVPLLDYTIVEFALNLNENLKVHNGVQKYLLKQVLYDYVPAHLFARPKWGFSIPLCKWLHTDLHYLIDEYLSETALAKTGIFSQKKVRSLIRQFNNGRNDYVYNRIWQLILVQKFLLEKI